jgi:DNA topoisomerase-1
LARIKRLAIPPAWTDVWICPWPNGHLQATGRNARGRKQYRYHLAWEKAQGKEKFDHIARFGRVLPALRRAVDKDLRRPGLARQKVLAAVVRLLDTALIRVGNEEYARNNGSFGLTTLRDKHVKVARETIAFQFRGKSGLRHAIKIKDGPLARIVKTCQELPGQELFQYLDDQGRRHSITSQDVNDYLRRISGADFSAKDFRTWAGTVLAVQALSRAGDAKSSLKSVVVQAVKEVASQLGNTPTICRNSYIHPAIVSSYLSGAMTPIALSSNGKSGVGELRSAERAVLRLLRRAEKTS